jgi:hypothetical protein
VFDKLERWHGDTSVAEALSSELQRRAAVSGEWKFQPCSALLPNLRNLNSAAHSLGTRILHSLTWHRHRVDYLKAVLRRRRSSPPVGVAERQIGW